MTRVASHVDKAADTDASSLPVGVLNLRFRAMFAIARAVSALGLYPRPERLALQSLKRRQQRPPRWLAGAPRPDVRVDDCFVALSEREVRVRVYRQTCAGPAPALLYLHGGGFIAGGVDSTDNVCRELAALARMAVVSVDYRLAPQTPYPGQLDDASGVLAWMRSHGEALQIDASRIGVAGDSAGGNLAAALALQQGGTSEQPLRCQLLFYPCLDATLSTRSMQTYRGPGITSKEMHFYYQAYAASSASSPGVSVLHAASVGHAPPAIVITAGFDPLRDEAADYVRRLADAGVPSRLHHFPDAPHGFVTMPRLTADAERAIAAAAADVHHHLYDGNGA